MTAQADQVPVKLGSAPRKCAPARLLGRVLETHISLPLFALPLLAAIWLLTSHFIGVERAAASAATQVSLKELGDTYEAQVARNLVGIDQTLKVLKYAVELNGPSGALPTLGQKGLLPSNLVFVVAIADHDGMIIASNPAVKSFDVSAQHYFNYHRATPNDTLYVSEVMRDAGNPDYHLHFTRRLNDADGQFAGIVIVETDPAYFTSGYERSRQGELGALALFGTDGTSRVLRVGEHVSWGQAAPAEDPNAASGEQAGVSSWDGVRRFSAMRRLHGFPLNALVGLAESEEMAEFETHRRNYLLAASAASALLILSVTLVCLWSWQLTKTRRRVRHAQETYAAASEASTDAFFVLRSVHGADREVTDFLIEATNTRAEQMARKDKAALRGQRLCEMIPACRDNGVFDDLMRVTKTGGVHEAEWREGPHEHSRWLHRQVVAVEGGLVAIVRDITERKLAEERIKHMAHHDDLTGLPNRSLIRDRLQQAILHAERHARCVAVAFIDLDSFKLVNDGLGHNAGDELLKVVGARIKDCVRRTDTLGRFGGDEFVIVLGDQDDNPMALAPLLEKIRQAVAQPVLLSGQEVQISCSMGVVMYPRDGVDPNTLMMNADAAMYRAKELGNNNYQFYAREMNASVEEKLVLLEGLRYALEDQQFKLLYQPKLDLRSGRIFGVEALIRWHHPEHGVIPPDRFIGLAEESGLIVAIGDWVMHTACRQNMAWRAAGLAPITISVNVSPRQFEDRSLVGRVADALAASKLPADALEVEVTESLIMRDLSQSIGKMTELKAMGVALSIDDFGTGYSSLSALKSFPISRLKIDKSFVSELADNADDQAIALAVISLGHKLNLRVIAEGVETAQQRDFLRANDCDEMQGYLFSRPVEAEAIARLLAEQAAQETTHVRAA
jgi:diguanylate cyclase (GGDEF)-like protein